MAFYILYNIFPFSWIPLFSLLVLMYCLKCKDFKVYFLLVWTDENARSKSELFDWKFQSRLHWKMDASWKLSLSSWKSWITPVKTIEFHHLKVERVKLLSAQAEGLIRALFPLSLLLSRSSSSSLTTKSRGGFMGLHRQHWGRGYSPLPQAPIDPPLDRCNFHVMHRW
jgi:hypothetical protein